MHLFQSQDEQSTPEYNPQESGMFGNGKKYQDPKSINRLITDVEKMKFDGNLNKKPEIKIGGEKVKLNMSIIDEMSETTYQG
jgi:hypothetical protein